MNYKIRKWHPTSVFLPGDSHGQRSWWATVQGVGHKELDTTERLGTSPFRASQVALVIKHLPASAGDIRDLGLILGFRRSPGGGHGDPLQHSCLEHPMDRGVGGLQPMGSQRVGHD